MFHSTVYIQNPLVYFYTNNYIFNNILTTWVHSSNFNKWFTVIASN